MRLRVLIGLVLTSMLGSMYAAAGLLTPGWQDVAAGLAVAVGGLLALFVVEEIK